MFIEREWNLRCGNQWPGITGTELVFRSCRLFTKGGRRRQSSIMLSRVLRRVRKPRSCRRWVRSSPMVTFIIGQTRLAASSTSKFTRDNRIPFPYNHFSIVSRSEHSTRLTTTMFSSSMHGKSSHECLIKCLQFADADLHIVMCFALHLLSVRVSYVS